MSAQGVDKFQSTPVIANGRIMRAMSAPVLFIGFNPRPLLLTGESRCRPRAWTRPWGFNPRVSIHARYC